MIKVRPIMWIVTILALVASYSLSAAGVDPWRQDPRRPASFPRGDKDSPLSDKEVELLNTGTLILNNIRFELNEATILSESYPTLDEVGGILAKWPELEIEIGGHTDSWGEEAYNLELSQRRARAVLDYLLESSPTIEAKQYSSNGYGESRPVANNDTPEGRAKNRRVEFTVLNKGVLEQ